MEATSALQTRDLVTEAAKFFVGSLGGSGNVTISQGSSPPTHSLISSSFDNSTSSLEPFTGSGRGPSGVNLEAVINGIAGTAMTLITFFGQILVFVVVSKDNRLRTPNNYFIISLATADLLISTISMPVWTVFSTLGYWPLSQVWCDIWNIFDYVLCCVSIYTILFISLDRYLVLKHPFTYPIKRTSTKAKLALIGIWIVTAVVFSAYIGLTQVFYGTTRDPLDCSTYYLLSVPLTYLMVSMVHWGSILGTLILYVMIYRIAATVGKLDKQFDKKDAKKSKESKYVVPSEDVSTEQSTNSTTLSNSSQAPSKRIDTQKKQLSEKESREEKERKAVRTIALLLAVFAACWLPLSFIFVITAMYPGYLSIWWMIMGYWLGYINSMLNPICYAIGNPYFKETLGKMFSCHKTKG